MRQEGGVISGKRVLLVCTGNTCRSPMAVALFRKILQEDYPGQVDQLDVDSAGIHTVTHLEASPEAIQVLADDGIDLTGHRSKMVEPEMVDAADLILTMTAAHKSFLVEAYPQADDKIFTLKEFTDNPGDEITDPFGLGVEAYRKSYLQLKQLIPQVIKGILVEGR